MGVLSSLGRVVLVILNILFVIISLGLIAGGAILKFTPSMIMSFLAAGVDALIPPTLSGNIPVPKTLSFVPMFADIGIALLVSGCILFVLSFLACCGACCKWRPFLIVFVIIMIIIIVVIGVLGALLLVKDSILHKNIRDTLADKAVKEYKKEPQGAFSQIMNLLDIKMNCCGFGGPVDYGTNSSLVPPSCCKTLDQTCALGGKGPFHEEGCYSKLTDLLEDNKTWAIVALVVLLLLLLVEVIFAVLIVVDTGKDKVRPI